MAAGTSEHDALREQAASYVLGALPPLERDAFERHLATCAECAAEVRALSPVADSLAHAVPQMDPPAELRARVLAVSRAPDSARRESRNVSFAVTATEQNLAPWLLAAASTVLAIGLGAYVVQLRGRVESLDQQLRETVRAAAATESKMAEIQRAANGTQSMVGVISAPDVARIDLAGQPVAPGASGRAFWSRSRGLVFAASNLPQLPAGKVYQVWVVVDGQDPISAGVITPDADGRANAVVATSPTMPTPTLVAVTQEAAGGVEKPTSEMYLVGKVSTSGL